LPADLTPPWASPELAEPDAAEELVVDAVNDTLKAIAASLSIFSLLVVTPIVTLYLLNDWDGLIATIDRSVPVAQRETVRTLSREIDDRWPASCAVKGRSVSSLPCIMRRRYG
jgi:predicted PurR-regulated permease PerM